MKESMEIGTATLSHWLAEKKVVTILDVRPASERKEWKIPGSIHIDAYDRLWAKHKGIFDNVQFPNAPVVTVCAAGRTSLLAAEQLKQRGLEAYSLEGGMKAWNFAWNSAELLFGDVKVIQIRRSSKGCLSYIIGSAGKAMVIDASLDPLVYMNIARENGWTVENVADTHVHADYLSRTRELATATRSRHLMIDKAIVDYSFVPVGDGEKIQFGNATVEVIHTPGHTLDSTTFKLADDAIFTGDTLFVDGIGRPDLKADHQETMRKARLLRGSLQKLMMLDPGTLVLPAHFAAAVPFDGQPISKSINEVRTELNVLQLNEKDFIDYVVSHTPPTPANYLTIAALNKKGSFEGYNPADLEAGANRCAID